MKASVVTLSLLLAMPTFVVGRAHTKTKDQRSKRVSSNKATIKFSNPSTLSTPPGYTHVVEAAGGRTVYIAGQVALDKSGNLVGRGDFHAQAEQVFENLKAALDAAGGTFKDIVKLNYYVSDMSQIASLREVRDKYVNKSAPPASTLVQVVRLFREEFLIEVEAIAVM
jgi:reactive intermediate/imine deaminase